MNSRFRPGSPVRVSSRDHTGHFRTPDYIRGKRGIVERVCGNFLNPEDLAYGRRRGAPVTLYRVRFKQTEVWPDYGGPQVDSVDIELYEHWLEPEEKQ